MARFKPAAAFNVPMVLLIPTYTKEKGVPTKAFPDPENGIRINGSFKSYGGTERDVNGIYSVDDTAWIETWYRPDITAACRICLLETGEVYEILGKPEDIERRHQFLRFKVQAYEGGA